MQNRELRRERLLGLGITLSLKSPPSSYSIFSEEEFESKFPERAKNYRKWNRQFKVYRKLFDEFMKDEPYDRIGIDQGHPEGSRSITLGVQLATVREEIEFKVEVKRGDLDDKV